MMTGLGFSCIHSENPGERLSESWRKKCYSCKFLHWKGRNCLTKQKVHGEEAHDPASTRRKNALGFWVG